MPRPPTKTVGMPGVRGVDPVSGETPVCVRLPRNIGQFAIPACRPVLRAGERLNGDTSVEVAIGDQFTSRRHVLTPCFCVTLL